ncbi:hypothetical protein PAMA_013730 [Pampus argenteus]
MNAILLIAVIFTLGLGFDGVCSIDIVKNKDVKKDHDQDPCEKIKKQNVAYIKFRTRHIFPDEFNTESKDEWRTYLEKQQLCHRPRQSFITEADEEKVLQICQGSSRHVEGNLCVSDSRMMVYELRVGDNCEIQSLWKHQNHVTVGCNRHVTENKCLPVHYEKTKYPLPNESTQRCGSPPKIQAKSSEG